MRSPAVLCDALVALHVPHKRWLFAAEGLTSEPGYLRPEEPARWTCEKNTGQRSELVLWEAGGSSQGLLSSHALPRSSRVFLHLFGAGGSASAPRIIPTLAK